MDLLIAYCWASGQIEFGSTVPEGAIEIVRGSDRAVRDGMDVTARHGYEPGVLLVPGVPEAPDQKRAAKALQIFKLWLAQRERPGFRVAVQFTNPFDHDLCGTPVSTLSADDRCRAVANFDQSECLSALLVPGLQASVRKAIDRRLRRLLKAEVAA